jgi:ankyrin repeat protein
MENDDNVGAEYPHDDVVVEDDGGRPYNDPSEMMPGVVPGDEPYYYDGTGMPPPQHPHPIEETYDDSIPDILLLNHYCAHAFPPENESEEAKIAADISWTPVREWLSTHNDPDQVRAAIEQRDDAGKTALHFACQNAPPKDVIDVFLSVAEEIVQWPDSFGWLPIHYACAYGADTAVIKSLADAFPESKTTVDRKGRTPLHFALGTSNSNSPAVVVLLSSTGAASYADDNGMLVSTVFVCFDY